MQEEPPLPLRCSDHNDGPTEAGQSTAGSQNHQEERYLVSISWEPNEIKQIQSHDNTTQYQLIFIFVISHIYTLCISQDIKDIINIIYIILYKVFGG